MPPVSSLVFVVILAVWAVYLVQHWVRRRDHLATARSVDRFSEAMRVLERRRSLPVPEADAPRSYAASPLRPARPGRPEVVVKHARTAHGATAVGPSPAQRRSRWAARLRASGLLAGWVAMAALTGLSMAGVLPRWAALLGVALCGLSVALVRWSVARQRSARRRARTAGRPAAPRRTAPARPAAVTVERPVADAGRPSQDGHEFTAQSVAATLRTTSRGRPARPAASATPELYDLHAVEASLVDAGARAAVAPAAPVPHGAEADQQAPAPAEDGTWHPVPVPPPTYTLKAKAYRPLPGTSTLPADGTEMALEEEFEDLPRIDRVG
ncbi:hypothetical protein [Ornithinimicrobium pekingense]|uniref:Uncharacterized protein n=1 Tax=Ornithinimicrobium pekingense TaxID=384677 RepID=A0ABQ2FEJ2_9MICO|nr:hypothetical protein [Ornithinimicrobium pekingense]GGK81574.1 hypothetical protein GCM10011509_32540 [Ornithinimicrobium pekingense]